MKTNMFSEKMLGQNEQFSLMVVPETDREEARYYFVYSSGRRVETDKLGALIWKSLPAKAEDLEKKIGPLVSQIIEERGFNFSKFALEAYLYILYKAGIILIDGKIGAYGRSQKGLFIRNEDKKKDKNKDFLEWGDVNQTRISVVVVTYNGERFIRNCLKSLGEQSWPKLEVIVVDNGSSDRTCEIIMNDFPQVLLYRFSRNRHFARAVNFGLKKAKGEAILVLNQDVELEPDCVSHLILRRQKERTSPVGAVVPLIKFADLRGIVNGLGNHIRPFSWGSDNFIGAVDIGQFDQLETVSSACFAAVLIFREALNRAGFLDEAYGSFYEDVDWSFRCWLSGSKIVACPSAIVYHHFGSSYPEGIKLFFVCRNRLRLILKLFSGKRRLRFLHNYLIEDARAFLSFIRQRNWPNFMIYIKAYFSLVISLPDIIIKRIKFKKMKIKERSEAEVLALNPESRSFLNSYNEPVINLDLIVDYYLKLIN